MPDDHDAYADFLTRPVWPKRHRTRLGSSYAGSSREELEAEKSSRERHLPGRQSVSNGLKRHAGTSGEIYDGAPHPDDFDNDQQQALVQAVINGLSQKDQLPADEKQELLKAIQDASRPEQVRDDFLKLFKDPRIVISAREAKELTPDFGHALGHSRKHGHARYSLPISESELKDQEWPGKEEQRKKQEEENTQKKQGEDSKAKQPAESQEGGNTNEDQQESKQGGVSASDQKVNREQDEGAEEGEPVENLTPEQRRFFDALVEEAKQINAFHNSDGQPGPAVEDAAGTSQVGYEIQIDDQFTPDNWIPRSNHLKRLTGKHPLNAEADLRELYDAGMITPVRLHYVRNHGAVPKLAWETHSLEVFSQPASLMPKARSFTMDDLAALPALEIAVTIACDGNRRGEVNMVKRSSGFTWSSAGVSTCKWKGVPVRHLLLACGLTEQPHHERWYLHYEGADEPSEGRYATSIPLSHAMNPQNDVLVAYAINGRVLSPDHGYPLRSIIPGFVGGRQVKWLKKLWVSKKANNSHYHIWDNRLMPPFITDKNSVEGKFFFHHPDTQINDQCLQSITCRPSHGEAIPITPQEMATNSNITCQDKSDPLASTYRVQGFAYNGGGNAIHRVEISLNGGREWQYCLRKFADAPLRHGEKYWTWIHWYCDVALRSLCQSTEIIVRCFDAFKNSQPEHITWNYTGMMNNCWYRVKLHTDVDKGSGQPALLARHPIAPGGAEGGWQKPSPEEQAKTEAAEASQSTTKVFTLEQVEKHNTEEDCWIILNGKVYDATSVLAWHPGGASAILNYAGKATAQASADYNAIHDAYAQKKTEEVLIGKLSEKGVKALQEDQKEVNKKQAAQAEARKAFALKPFQYLPATLIKRKEINNDTRLYTFKMPDIDGKPGRLGLHVGGHIQIASHWNDAVVMRPYTPTRPVLPHEEDGTFDLLIKTYLPNASAFPPGGTLSNYLDALQEGEQIDINGPTGEIAYKGKGHFEIEGKAHHFDKLNLVAGGSGVTPIWQLIHAVLKGEDDDTKISLIDSNKSYDDILLVDELEQYAQEHGKQFSLWHTLSKKPEDRQWKYSEGHLDQKMMEEHFFKPDGYTTGTFLCGPPGLIKKGAIPALQKIGFEEGKTMFGF